MDFREEYKQAASKFAPDEQTINRIQNGVMSRINGVSRKKPLPLGRIALVGSAAACAALVLTVTLSLGLGGSHFEKADLAADGADNGAFAAAPSKVVENETGAGALGVDNAEGFLPAGDPGCDAVDKNESIARPIDSPGIAGTSAQPPQADINTAPSDEYPDIDEPGNGQDENSTQTPLTSETEGASTASCELCFSEDMTKATIGGEQYVLADDCPPEGQLCEAPQDAETCVTLADGTTYYLSEQDGEMLVYSEDMTRVWQYLIVAGE